MEPAKALLQFNQAPAAWDLAPGHYTLSELHIPEAPGQWSPGQPYLHRLSESTCFLSQASTCLPDNVPANKPLSETVACFNAITATG